MAQSVAEQKAPTADADLFSELVRTHMPWIYGMALRRLRDAALAEDATQAVFIALWTKRQKLFGNPALGGWLMRATRYAANDLIKSETRRRRREQRTGAMHQGQSTEANAGILEVLLNALDGALAKLPEGERALVVLRYFEGRSIPEIATLLKISDAAAQKRLSRMVLNLRLLMRNRYGPPNEAATGELLTVAGKGVATTAAMAARILQIPLGPGAAPGRVGHAATRAFASRVPMAVMTGAVIVAAATVAGVLAHGFATVSVTPAGARGGGLPEKTPAFGRGGTGAGEIAGVTYEMLINSHALAALRKQGKSVAGKRGTMRALLVNAAALRAMAVHDAPLGSFQLGAPNLSWLSLRPRGPAPMLSIYGDYYGLGAGKADNVIAEGTIAYRAVAYANYLLLNISRGGTHAWASAQVPKVGGIPRRLPLTFPGALRVPAGQAVIFTRRALLTGAGGWYFCVVMDAERYPLRSRWAIAQVNSIHVYLHGGPREIRKWAAAAVAWNAYARRHPPTGPAWPKAMPYGRVVSLRAITNNRFPLLSWNPAGQPVTWQFYTRRGCAELWRVKLPKGYVEPPAGQTVHTAFSMFISGQQKIGGTLRLGVDAGPWKIIGDAVLSPNSKKAFYYKGSKFIFYSAQPGFKSMFVFTASPVVAPQLANDAIGVGAINDRGKLIGPSTVDQLPFETSRASATEEYQQETIFVPSSKQIRRYVWVTRRRRWAVFHNVPMQPKILPAAVERKMLTVSPRFAAAPSN